jgi:phosphate starvation-inducible PhoH-like protein
MPKSQKNSQSSKAKRKHFKTINGGKSYASNNDSAFEDMDWHPLDDKIDQGRDKKYVKNITPRTEGQKGLMDAIKDANMTVAMGPAGTGKTYLAVALGVEALLKGDVDRIILSRPAMEAGESLGYLPGDMHEKMAPYLRPLYDVLGDRLGGKKVRQLLDDGTIEIAPIGFMRGRTLNNAFVVIDEAQNCTYQQLKMILSRLGWHSTMVITGDPAQSDLLNGLSGLNEIAEKLNKVDNISVVELEQRDIVRHPLVAEMLDVL